jgi:di/tricarboxylate transporter
MDAYNRIVKRVVGVALIVVVVGGVIGLVRMLLGHDDLFTNLSVDVLILAGCGGSLWLWLRGRFARRFTRAS